MAAFSVPLLVIAQNFGINPVSMMYYVSTVCDQVIFPYEYLKYLVFFAFGVIPMKEFIKYGAIKSVLHLIVCFALLLPWWMFTGFLYS